ncbi:hypothetical protein PMI14_04778, partial [Acidovorax sp. CF316]|uniref:DUF4347 domain-containing protein n=1 Tax=Acidovorax sp. CF316 TaxID=1144317 RepID=UPI00026BDF57
MTRHAIDQHHQPQGACASPQSMVFVFDDLHDWQTLAAAAPAGAEVVVLDGWGDGLAQMAAHLQGRSGIAALHVLSHGTPGSLLLGSLQLTTALVAEHAQVLSDIGSALAEDGDILVYGCQAGAGNVGADFVQALALATGAHMAAATDLVGAAHLGGNWRLDRQHGAVGTAPLSGLAQYQQVLAPPADQDFAVTAGQVGGVTSTLDYNGVRYTLTGGSGYEHMVQNPGAFSPTNSTYLMLDTAGIGAATVTVSATDGSAFRLKGLSFLVEESVISGTPFVDYTLTPQGGNPLTFTTDTKYQLYDFSSNTDFYNITSFTFSATAIGYPQIFVSLDDIDFDTPIIFTLPSLAATGGNPSFTENASTVDLFNTVTAATNDAGQTFKGMVLTVSNVTNGSSEVLTIGGTDVALVNGNSGTLTGIGSYSVSVSGSTATVTATGMTRTDAQMGTLVDGMTYRNTSQDPGNSNRVVTITSITDSGGSNATASPTRVSTVSVTPVNDAPTATATGGTPTFTENGSAADLFSGVSIGTVETGQAITAMGFTVANVADGTNEKLGIDGSQISLTNGNSGTTATNSFTYSVSVAAGTATVTLTKVAGISTAAAQILVDGVSYQNTSEVPTTATNRVITLTSIQDNGGTSNGGVDTTSLAIAATVTVVAVNDAPTLSGGPFSLATTNEDTPSTGTLVSTLLAGLTHNDVDGPASGVAITAHSGNGTWQYSTDGVTWNGVGSVSASAALLLSATTQVRYVPDSANGETATLTVRAWDQTSGTASTNSTRNVASTTTNGATTAFSTGTAQASLSVSSVNDLPVDTTSGGNTAFLQGNNVASTPVVVDSGFTVTDVDNTTLASATVAITGAFQSGEDELAFTSVFGTMGNISGSYDSATGVMTLTSAGATATLAQWQVALRAVTYTNTSASPDTANRTISFTTNDGSVDGNTATKTITVAATNQTPIATASGGTTAFIEGANTASTPVVVDSGLTISDADNNTFASATVRITGSFQAGQDVLGFTNIPAMMGNINASYDAATGELTLTSGGASATLLQWQAALRSVTYTNSSDTPNTANRTVSFTVNDGNSSSTAATTTVTVANRNDAPVNQVPATQATPQNTALVFNTGNGNLVSISDADSGAGSVKVTLTATNGLLTLSGTTGLAFLVGSGTSDATMTFEGTLADINTALNGMGFTPASGYNGMASIQIATDDQGLTGTGGNQTDTDTISITVGVIPSPDPTPPPPTTVDGVPVT